MNDSKNSGDRELYGGLIRLHILHHAGERRIYGAWIMEELRRHGYGMSPGTLYPMLHSLEEKGFLRSSEERSGKQARRFYVLTVKGKRALNGAKQKVRELYGELFEEDS